MNPNLNKRGFLTQEESENELRRIIETNYNCVPARNKKPVRTYFDKDLKMWYLTSQPKIVVY